MIRVLLDTNVLAPGFVGHGSTSVRLIDLWREGVYDLVFSDHLLQELARTFTDRYYAQRVPRADAEAILMLLGAGAIVAALTADVQGVASRVEDDLVLATALSGNASIICTQVKQLLKLGQYQGVAYPVALSPLALMQRRSTSIASMPSSATISARYTRNNKTVRRVTWCQALLIIGQKPETCRLTGAGPDFRPQSLRPLTFRAITTTQVTAE